MKINLVNDNPIIDKIVEKLEKNFHIILDEYEKRTNPSVYFDFIFWLKSCEKFYIFLGLYIIYIQVQKISGEDKNYDWEEVTKDKFPITHSIINSFNYEDVNFSKLGGNINNVLHKDSTTDKPLIRIHLPLIVPKGDIGIEVNSNLITWEEGKCIVFDTSIPHRFWNFTGHNRVNLLMSIFI